MGSSNSKQSRISELQISSGTAARGLPTVLRFSYKKSLSLKLHCLISEPDAEPTFSVSLPNGIYGPMILHDGPTDQDAPLVTVKKGGRWGEDFVVDLPPIARAGIPGCQELVRNVTTFKSETFWFGLTVGEGQNRQVERFEWRRTRGSEVKSLGQASDGWKLVRVGNSSFASTSGRTPGRRDGFSREGNEIVAVWAQGKMFSGGKNLGEFQLRGTGATGEFGVQWGLMAIMSCFCIWQQEVQGVTTPAPQ